MMGTYFHLFFDFGRVTMTILTKLPETEFWHAVELINRQPPT